MLRPFTGDVVVILRPPSKVHHSEELVGSLGEVRQYAGGIVRVQHRPGRRTWWYPERHVEVVGSVR